MRKGFPALALAVVLGLSGCAPAKEESTTIFAMDTVMTLTILGPRESLNRAVEDIYRMEGQFSATREDSPVTRLNRGETLSPSLVLCDLLDRGLTLCERTGGNLDLTAYPATLAWGFPTGEYRVPDEGELAKLAEGIDYGKIELISDEEGWYDLTLPAGTQIDLGAVAKGYAGDMLAADLKRDGITSALLDLGQSTIVAIGQSPKGQPWRIGIQDPTGELDYLGVLSLNDQSMGSSGDYQRYFERDGVRYSHIIDPATAAPADSGLAGVTVVADSAMLCDGLSTALFVMGLEEGADHWREHRDFEAIFIEEDGGVTVTAGLKDSFEVLENYAGEVCVLE